MRPARDRNHELETESQRAFESILPPNLVCRPITDDYGVDREVELFVEGQATGLTFKVQLKATDSSGTSRRIAASHVEYWNELDVPVLLVSYEASSGITRVRWAHSIGQEKELREQKTVTVSFERVLRQNDPFFSALPRDLGIIRTLRRGRFPEQITVGFETDESPVDGVHIAAAVLAATQRGRFPLRPVEDRCEPVLCILVESGLVRVSLPHALGSVSFHLVDFPWWGEAIVDELQDLVLIVAALLASQVDLQVARDWLRSVRPTSRFWDGDGGDRLLSILDTPELVTMLVSVTSTLVANQSDLAAQAMRILTHRVDEVDAVSFASFSELILKTSKGKPSRPERLVDLAWLTYLRNDWKSAVQLVQMALDEATEPARNAKAGFVLAAASAQNPEARIAVAHMRTAMHFGAPGHLFSPVLARLLLLDGKYGEADREMDAWVPAGDLYDSVGVVTATVIARVKRLGGEEQARYPLPVPASKTPFGEATANRAEAIDLLRSRDAVCFEWWKTLVDFNRPRESYYPALICAFLRPDAYLWACVLLLGLNAKVSHVELTSAADCARVFVGSDFYYELLAMAKHQPSGKAEDLRVIASNLYLS